VITWLRFRIGGQRWRVVLVSPKSKHLANDEGDRLHGACDYERAVIYISRSLEGALLVETALHEILHALLYVTGAEKVYNGNAEKDELLVSSLTPALHAVLLDLGFKFPTRP
jgi:hypothetical protein